MTPALEVLQRNGIEIETDPRKITQLPPYAKDLRDMLLNFERVVPFNKVCSASLHIGILNDNLSSSLSRRMNCNHIAS